VRNGWYAPERVEPEGWTGAAIAELESAPELAVRAGRCALDRSGLAAEDIAILVHSESYHSGPDLWYPQHYILRHTVGRPIPALALKQGCTAMLQAIELAGCWLAASDADAALLTGADRVGTPQLDRWNYANGHASGRGSIMGDAGTALVLSRRSGIARVLAVRSGSMPDLEELYRGDEPLYPAGATTGTPIRLGARMRAAADRDPGLVASAPRRLRAARTELAQQTLAEAGVRPADVTRVTHVFAGQRLYLEDLLRPLGIDPERGMLEFGRSVGHLTVNDHVAALDHLLQTGAVHPGDHILMIANGVGVSLACAVLQIELPGLPGAGGRGAVTSEDPEPVGAAGGGGAVRVQDKGPAPAVHANLMMKVTD
jgi:3-oxoacyl-[acyl-carrier-protein] synthase III